jgi:E3 ubiquitin-protein ligase HERC4
VFHNDFTLEDKKKFLLFLTGCDRIPVSGTKALALKIQRSAETSFLPVAHTCFNLLDLPEYPTREKLKYMLLKAVQHTQGFGLA